MNSNKDHLIALVDADNFYASCERVFRPALQRRPVVVLSNNDGCVIARSQEVKGMGVKMGTPFFKLRELAATNKFAVFSSNYELYGDMSARFMAILGGLTLWLEPYSIDEAFARIDRGDPHRFCRRVVADCRDWLSLPMKVGVSHTKTLAKVATECVKKSGGRQRWCVLDTEEKVESALARIELEDVWGVGRRTAMKLRAQGIDHPGELRDAPLSMVRKRFGVMLARTVMELRGKQCFELETQPPPRKNLCVSRGFGHPISDYAELLESVTAHATTAAAKLRRQGMKAQSLSVFVETNRFRGDVPQYAGSFCLSLPLASNATPTMVRLAARALKQVYRSGYWYNKSGVMLNELVSASVQEADLFVTAASGDDNLSKAIDAINSRYGRNSIGFGGAVLKHRPWHMSQKYLSPRYTTRWSELKCVV
jgi:DNA polymerase V